MRISTILRLGIINVVRVASYRIKLKFGFHSVQKISARLEGRDFFYMPKEKKHLDLIPNLQWKNSYVFYGWRQFPSSGIPNWFKNYFNNIVFSDVEKDWWTIPDFDAITGDIKCIWELSRFDWAIAFAQKASQGNQESLHKLNTWLTDWSEKNPPYKGPNWKCGQETSIKLMHLAMAAYLLQQTKNTSKNLLDFIEALLKRIAPTISYAIAQNNNHGTSEAAALFIGGSWLRANGRDGSRWEALGRKWLENRAKHLIENDGSFSQYSVNYHRVMLDTYCMAEIWRRKLALSSFSHQLTGKLKLATNWLHTFTQIENGDVPNLGANDGARLLPLTNTDYRDFRPSVQLASVLFCAQKAYKNKGSWDLPLQWMDIDSLEEKESGALKHTDSVIQHFAKGGYVILGNKRAHVYFRYPKFRFRPSQSDVFHLDFWLDGKNVLRDGGSYSYNLSQEVTDYYSGVASHNTVQFDELEQMPKISRFLFGAWAKLDSIQLDEFEKNVLAVYTDFSGNKHSRRVCLEENLVRVEDTVSLVGEKAKLRWRLLPGEWEQINNTYSSSDISIQITADKTFSTNLLTGYESRYYFQQTELPVIEVEVCENAKIVSTFAF